MQGNPGTPPAKDRPRGGGDATDEFEEYTSPPRRDEQGNPIPKSRGLRAGGYEFPPRDPNPPMTKANLAKGMVPDAKGFPAPPPAAPATSQPARPQAHPASTGARPAPTGGVNTPQPRSPFPMPSREATGPAPSMSKIADDGMSEVYERPGLTQQPRTGRGLRTPGPEAPRAGEILASWKEPTPDVVTPKKFQVFQGRERPKDTRDGSAAQHAEAEVHASVDVSTAPDATMSHSSAYGPTKTIVDEDPLASLRRPVTGDEGLPALPEDAGDDEDDSFDDSEDATPATPTTPSMSAASATSAAVPQLVEEEPMPTPPSPAPAVRRQETTAPQAYAPRAAAPAPSPHVSNTPRAPGMSGAGCRIAIVQAEFNLDITDAMAHAAKDEIKRLGATLAGHSKVPGAFDTPLAAQHLLKRNDVDGVVVIGCIIQGQTGHDELIAHATAKSLQELSLRFEKPVGLSITGPRMTESQARARIDAAAFVVGSVVAQHKLRA